MQPAERYLAEKRLTAWRSFFEGRVTPLAMEQSLTDLALFVKYIDYLKGKPKHDTLHIPSIMAGMVLMGIIIFAGLIISGAAHHIPS